MPQMCCSAWLAAQQPLRQVGGAHPAVPGSRLSLRNSLPAQKKRLGTGSSSAAASSPRAGFLRPPRPALPPPLLPPQVIIAGAPADPLRRQLLAAAHGPLCPDKTLVLLDPADRASLDFWRAHNPQAVAMVGAPGGPACPARRAAPRRAAVAWLLVGRGQPRGWQPAPRHPLVAAPAQVEAHYLQKRGLPATAAAFVCQNFTCQAPTSDPAQLRQLLQRRAGGAGGAPVITRVNL